MHTRIWTTFCGAITLLVIIGGILGVRQVMACPFCNAVSQTFAEEMAALEAAVFAKMIEPPKEPEDPDDAYAELPMATFEVIEVLKGEQWVKVGDKIRTHYFGSLKDSHYLIMGTDSPEIMWASPLPLSERGEAYVRKAGQLPSGAERLIFFQDYLEDSDELLARDAYDEFAKAPYADVIALKPHMDRQKIVNWVKDTVNVPASRRSLYITMLGVCGEPEDVAMLETFLRSDERSDKIGLNALVACYLTLRGEDGMQTIEELFLKNPKAEYADTYAAITALRFHGAETTVLPLERILSGLRCLLDRPELADLVIPDLARWEDWSVLDRMGDLFRQADEESNWVRVPIVNYVRACPLPEAKTLMAELQELDPESVKRASMFLPFGPPKKAEQAASDAASNDAASIEQPKPLDPSESTSESGNAPPEAEEFADLPKPPPADSISEPFSTANRTDVKYTATSTSKTPSGRTIGISALVLLTLAIVTTITMLGGKKSTT